MNLFLGVKSLNSHIIICGPTGVAARNVEGLTAHSAFRLPVEKLNLGHLNKLKGRYLEDKKRQWKNINWVVVDEVSMISYETLRRIHLRLCEYKQSEELFGGVNVILIGDLLQLDPVRGHPIYIQPECFSNEPHLWRCFQFFEFEQNERQKTDTNFSSVLGRIRIGEQTSDDMKVLTSRKLANLSLTDQFDDALHIIGTKVKVKNHNEKMFQNLKNFNHKVYDISSINIFTEGMKSGRIATMNDMYTDEGMCGGLLSDIQLSISCRVMLRKNIKVPLLVNGSIGIIKGFEWSALRREQLEPGDMPIAVLVDFDDKKVSELYDDCNNEGFARIKPYECTFQGKNGTMISRTMIPLIHSWAVTIHKTQGITLDKAVVDLQSCFDYGMEYVSLSRIKTLNGLAIMDINYSRFEKRLTVNPRAIEEIKNRKNKIY